MHLFNLLGNYKWDAKLALVLAAFAANYGEFWLLMQLYPSNPLAASVSVLRQLPNNLTLLRPRFKALSLLVKTLIDITKCIIKFESMSFHHVKLDDQAMVATKSAIYLASYWVIKSTATCSSQITDLIALKPEQVHVPSLQSAYKYVPFSFHLLSRSYLIWVLFARFFLTDLGIVVRGVPRARLSHSGTRLGDAPYLGLGALGKSGLFS